MVQVDFVWSYAFGATFAAAAARQLERQEKPFENRWYVFVLLFLSIFFAPSGIYLLWEHTQWETMQVATRFDDLPAWLVALFAVTNITQGILGYWVTFRLVKRKNYYGAHANWMAAWTLFWFILMCGWDCAGWQRFLYDMSVNGGELWEPGKHMGLSFFYASRVWWTLFVMGLCFAPMLVYGYLKFTIGGARMDPSIAPEKVPHFIKVLVFNFGTQFGVCLGLALFATLAVTGIRAVTGSLLAAYLIGVPACSAAAYFLLFRRGMPMQFIARQLYVKEPDE